MNDKPTDTIQSTLDNLYAKGKTLTGLVSIITSLVTFVSASLGAIFIMAFFSAYDLLYIFSSNLSFTGLLARCTIGLLVINLLLLFLFGVIPTILGTSTLSLIGQSKINAELNDAKINQKKRKIETLWGLAFLIPTAVLFIVYFSVSGNLSNTWMPWLTVISIILLEIFIIFCLLKQYSALYKLSEQADKMGYTLSSVLFLLVSIIPLTTFMSLIDASFVSEKWIVLGVFLLLYFAFFSLAISRASTSTEKKPFKLLGYLFTISMIFLTVITFISYKTMLVAALSPMGMKDTQGDDISYEYRFETNDVVDELTIFKEHVRNTGKYSYINGFSLFRYKDVLILCPKDFDVVTQTATDCADMSGIAYRRYIKKVPASD